MRILLSTDQAFDDKYFIKYSNYALREDIIVVNYDNTKFEIQNRLLEKQEHFDLIIFDVEKEIDFKLNENILTYIRTAPDSYTYSGRNFKLNYIPIVFIYKKYMLQRNGDISLSNYHYNIEYINEKDFELYNIGISSSIDNWLNDLANDFRHTRFKYSV